MIRFINYFEIHIIPLQIYCFFLTYARFLAFFIKKASSIATARLFHKELLTT